MRWGVLPRRQPWQLSCGAVLLFGAGRTDGTCCCCCHLAVWLQDSPPFAPVRCSGVKDSVYAVAMDARGALVAAGSTEASITLLDARSGSSAMQLKGHTDNVRCVVWGCWLRPGRFECLPAPAAPCCVPCNLMLGCPAAWLGAATAWWTWRYHSLPALTVLSRCLCVQGAGIERRGHPAAVRLLRPHAAAVGPRTATLPTHLCGAH